VLPAPSVSTQVPLWGPGRYQRPITGVGVGGG